MAVTIPDSTIALERGIRILGMLCLLLLIACAFLVYEVILRDDESGNNGALLRCGDKIDAQFFSGAGELIISLVPPEDLEDLPRDVRERAEDIDRGASVVTLFKAIDAERDLAAGECEDAED